MGRPLLFISSLSSARISSNRARVTFCCAVVIRRVDCVDSSKAFTDLRLWFIMASDIDGRLVRVVLMRLLVESAPARPLSPGVFCEDCSKFF